MTPVVLRRFWPAIAGAILLVGAAATLWWAGLDEEVAPVRPGAAPQVAAVEPAAAFAAYATRLDGQPVGIGRSATR